MRVAIDATPLLGPRTGVGGFTASLIERLAERDDVDVCAFPVSVRGRRNLGAEVPARVRVASPPLPARAVRSLWRHLDLPRIEWFVGPQDVVHGPNFVVPPSRAARVATVHDLTPLRFPELSEPSTLAYPALVRRAAARGAWTHVVSEAVRAEVVSELGLDPERVVAVAQGFTSMAGGDPAAGRRRAGTDDYLLAVGTVEPRKDLPSLVRALDALASHHPDLTLVHAGADGWGVAAFDDALGAMAHPDRVRRLGRITDDDRRDLYAGARLVCYPSVYEGFGLPVLEAMSAGVAVVTTDVPALREVSGDAAAIVAVGDVDALAGAIDRLWVDDHERGRLGGAGLDRCQAFTWDACIEAMVDLYRCAAAG